MNTERNDAPAASNFIRNIIDDDNRTGKWGQRVETRFPPEPNGYLHIGHAKSICLNFGVARSYGGVCHLRFDDTNPDKESVEYVDSIIDAVRWLGFEWEKDGKEHLYYASDYYDKLYEFAELLIAARQGVRRQPDRRRNAREPRLGHRSRHDLAVSRASRARKTSTCSAA